MSPIVKDAEKVLEGVVLRSGHGSKPKDDGKPVGCVMDVVSFIAGEPWSDHPECACPVVTRAAIAINDRIHDDALRTSILRPFILRIAGSKSTKAVERKRMFKAADLAVRVFAPRALELRGRAEDAARLRACAPIVDAATARKGQKAAAAAYAYAAAAAAAYAYDADARSKVWAEFGAMLLSGMLDITE